MSTTLPPGMTASKLRLIADYITEADEIIENFCVAMAEQGSEEIKAALSGTIAFVLGKEMQEELATWADFIELKGELP